MAKSILKSSRYPYIKVFIEVLQRDLKIEALVDTGFDGDISLPARLILNGKPPDGHTSWIIASGESLRAPYFFGFIKLGSYKLFVQIIVLGNEPIIGRGVLDQFKVTFDHGRNIIVEK